MSNFHLSISITKIIVYEMQSVFQTIASSYGAAEFIKVESGCWCGVRMCARMCVHVRVMTVQQKKYVLREARTTAHHTNMHTRTRTLQ